jgi:hypothetical protein
MGAFQDDSQHSLVGFRAVQMSIYLTFERIRTDA